MIVSTSRSTPVRVDHRVLADLGERRRSRARRCRCCSAGYQRLEGTSALAAERVVGRQRPHAAAGSATCLRDVGPRELGQLSISARSLHEAEHQQPPCRRTPRARTAFCAAGHAAGRAMRSRSVIGRLVWAIDPRRGALEDEEPLDVAGDLGHVLDRRGAGADRRDPLAGEVVARGPSAPSASTVPRNVSMPGTSGKLRLGQRPDRRHEHVRASSARGWSSDLPPLRPRRPTPPRRARHRTGCAGARRSCSAQRAQVVAGSPAAASRCCVHSGFGANENEYRCEGTSHVQPG